MNYNIKGTDLELSPEIREYVVKRLAPVEKLAGNEDAAQLDIELEHSEGAVPKFRAEFTLTRGSESFRGEERGDTLHEAIDIAIGELSRQLARRKDERTSRVRRSAVRVKEFLRGWRRRP